ncbi:MAG: sodium:proton antiporter [Deltaproteobacteria bacterium]|jgi:Na+/H+ antiporter NhaD/arsenite permease-like protein|nr:sodium:proton antiporter [Deltaproteobacteria bacterium]
MPPILKKKIPLPLIIMPPVCFLGLILCPQELLASSELHLDGASLSLAWALPFAGMLLSIALFPLFAAHFWEKNYGKVAIFWVLSLTIPQFIVFGPEVTLYNGLHTIVGEYIPFIIVLIALFTISGGIRVKGTLTGTPLLNLIILTIGTILASIMGTTGASMLLIRPFIRALSHRKYKTHSIIFFIFLVSNAGGCLTPLGDPPLFLGFIKGVDFFWTAAHLWKQTSFLCVILLILYFIIDLMYYRKEGSPKIEHSEKLSLEGKINFLLLFCVVGLVLFSGMSSIKSKIVIWGEVEYAVANLIRDLGLLSLAGLSLLLTKKESRRANHFTWAPILEVTKLFLGIFITMLPAITILRAGASGALGSLVSLVTAPDGSPVNLAYFWLTGALSSFLDNAPTYLVFFNSAGGDAQHLMHDIPLTLAAISCGAVFLGANTYIGNAPNFMVRSIAEERGIKMPSFFGYTLWSILILEPIFVVMSLIFF